MNNINQSTLKYDLCIGCGVCTSLCPVDAIKMRQNEEVYFSPCINEDICINCGLCSKYCPDSISALSEMHCRVANESDYNMFGMENALGFLVRSCDNGVEKSASGGITTAFSKKLIEFSVVDAVIHAKSISNTHSGVHFLANLSKTQDELDNCRGSFYAPINFSDVLDRVKNEQIKKILVIGTPCVTRAIKKLFAERKEYGVETCYTLSLACSHNVNGMFSSYMADTFKIDRDMTWRVNIRDKINAPNATNFNISFMSDDGNVLVRENRFKSQFVSIWRSYAFSMNCCNSCSDFWGADSDVSTKDAWGKWSYDKDAKSIVVVRNHDFVDILKATDSQITELSMQEIIDCQKETVVYKQGGALKRIKHSNPEKWNKIDFSHRIHAYVSKMSKSEYKKMLETGYTDKIINNTKLAQKLAANTPYSLLKRIINKLKKI